MARKTQRPTKSKQKPRTKKGATRTKVKKAPSTATRKPVRQPATKAARKPARQPAQQPAKQPAKQAAKQPAKQPAKKAGAGVAQALLAYAQLSTRDFTESVRLVSEGMFNGRAALTDGEAFGFDTPEGGMFVEAQLEPRMVRVAAHLGASRGDPARIAQLVSDTTARLMMGRVIETERAVFYVVDVPAEPFVPLHTAQAIVTARAAAPEIRAELAEILEG